MGAFTSALSRRRHRRGRVTAIAAVAALAALAVPAAPAAATTAADVITATTSASPTIGIIRTSTSQYVGVTLRANIAASAVTLSLVQSGTTTAYTGPFTFSTNGCSNRTLAVGYSCSSNIRFYSTTKGTFTADARYTFTSGGANYSGVISFSATAGTLPASPTALTTTVISRTSMRVGWTAPTDTGGLPLTAYRLTITDNSTTTSTDYPLSGTTTSYTAANLTLGTSFSFRVYASNYLGESTVPLAGSATFALPAPTPVTNFTATSRSTSIAATWTPSSGYVDGYKIQVFNRAPGGLTVDVATVPASTTGYTITGLTPATPYTVKVSAYNTSTSALATYDISTQRARPQVPTNFRVLRTSATSASIAWTAPLEDVDGYTIEISTDGTTWDDAGAPDDPTATTYEITDLNPITRYFIRISAYNSTDDPDGDVSAPITATTQSGLTNPVRNFTAAGKDETSVQLRWDAPLPSYVSTVTYRIESRDVMNPGTASQSASSWDTVDEVDANVTSYLVSGLTPCVFTPGVSVTACPVTQYRVISVSDWGDSDPGDVVNAAPDFRLASAASNAVASPTAPYQLSFSWKPAIAGSSPISGYTVFYSSDPADITCSPNDNGGCDVGGDSVDVDANTTSVSLTDLDPGAYYVTVVPRINSQAFGEIFGVMSTVAAAVVRGEITPVDTVHVVSVDNHSATVQWNRTATVWDAPTYRVQISSDGGTTWVDALSTTNNSATITGLQSGADYLVQVVASDAFTTTDPSDSDEFLLPLPAPTSVSVTSSNDSSVDVSWTNPDPGALITGWRLEQQVVAAGSSPSSDGWDEVATVETNVTAYHVGDLQPCDSASAPTGFCPVTLYRVVAVNDNEESAPSAVAAGSPKFHLAGTVAAIAAETAGAGSVTISWKAAAAGTTSVTGYTVYYSGDPADLVCSTNDFGGCDLSSDSVDTDAAATSVTLTDLDPGITVYAVVVAQTTSATWGDVTGPASGVVSASVPLPVETPSNLTLTTYGFRTASLTWDPVGSDTGPVSYIVQLSTDGGTTWADAVKTSDPSVDLSWLHPGTDYAVQVVAADRFSSSDPTDAVEFHTKSLALPSKPTVGDFTVDGGGTLTIDAGDDTGATNVSYLVTVVPNYPGGRALAVTCDAESLECDVPDALPGTSYRVFIKAKADGGTINSSWFIYNPPPIELDVTTDDVATNDSEVDIEAFNLRPGTAYVTYGRKRMAVDVDQDGYASASFTLAGLGRKAILITQGSRRATSYVWVVGAKQQQGRVRLHSTATVKVIGAAPGALVSIDTSTGAHREVVSTGATISFPIYMSDPDGVDFSITVDGVDIYDGSVATG